MKVINHFQTELMNLNKKMIKIGTKVVIDLDYFGPCTLTVQKISDNDAVLMFDSVLDIYFMNENGSNLGGFKDSDLKRYLEEDILPKFPENLKKQIKDITIPSYEEIFGHDGSLFLIPEEGEQFKLMKNKKNRIRDFQNDICWYWLRNSMFEIGGAKNSSDFVTVDIHGNPTYSFAYIQCGVVPEILVDFTKEV